MTSQKQAEANRKNAEKSTGPKTQEGKAVSRMNAVIHGLSGKHVVIRDENPADYELMVREMVEEFDPETVVEDALVQQLAGLIWRLRRIPKFEAAILEMLRDSARESYEDIVLSNRKSARSRARSEANNVVPEGFEYVDEELPVSMTELSPAVMEADETPDQKKARYALLELGRGLLKDAMVYEVFAKLARYEIHLRNQFTQTQVSLEQVQEKRRKEWDEMDEKMRKRRGITR